MKRAEVVLGYFVIAYIVGVLLLSIFLTTFSFLFRDGRGVSMYGGRGDFYMAP